MNILLSPYAPENLVSRDGFSRPVPRQPAHYLHTQAECGAYSRDSSGFPRRRLFTYLNRHTPSGQSRVNRVTHLRTDGVHYRESAGTVPVVLEVVPVTGPVNLQVTMDQLMCVLYVWSALSVEYGSSGYGYQSCSWSSQQGKWMFPCLRSRLRIWSRETGSAVPSRVSLLILHTQRLNMVPPRGIPPSFRDGVHIYDQPASG